MFCSPLYFHWVSFKIFDNHAVVVVVDVVAVVVDAFDVTVVLREFVFANIIVV